MRAIQVLVIDDDAALARMLRVTMLAEGFSVRIAGDGRAALAVIADTTPDVIVLDLQMPVMDGREFYRELRGAGHKMPVLILSAYGAAAAQVELGAEASMDKPFDPEVLMKRVRSLCN